MSEMLSGVLQLLISTSWWLIFGIWWMFKIWVCPPGRSLQTKLVAKVILPTI
jgi:hypothetical protein